MTKISKKAAYPVKIPVRKDYFVGTDSENNGKTVNFDFESTAKLINELNGTAILNYMFRTDSNIDLTVLTEGIFLSKDNATAITSVTKLYINKNNFYETDMSDLFRFIASNREVFLMKLRNSSNLNNSVYFKITGATEYESYFTLDVAVNLSNSALSELINYNVYFFDFELNSSDLVISLPEFNKIITQTGFTSTGTTITFNPSWSWLIKNVSYTNPSSVTKPITPTSSGKKRIDSFVLNTSGTFQVVTGAETIGSPIQELTPIDTLYVTFCIVGDAGIESVEPIDLSSYATIAYVDGKDTLLSDRITDLESAGYQLLEDQRLSTTDDVSFNSIDIAISATINNLSVAENTEYTDGTIVFRDEVTGNYGRVSQGTMRTLIGVNNVDDTSDSSKPVSTLQAAADATVLADGKTYADGLITQLINGAPGDANTLKELNDKILAVQAIIGGSTADGDALVNTVAELLAVFATFPEGVDLVTLLAGKVNTTDVYNALDCIVAGKVADARQLKVLNDLIGALTTVVGGKEPANANIQAHIASAHAPSNAQKNSDITKAEIEAKLTGEITTHTHVRTDTISYAISAPTGDLVTGDTDPFNAPYNFTLVSYWIGVKTAPTVSSLIVDVKKNGTSVTSTKAGIDATETTSLTGTSPVLTTTSFTKGDLITPNIYQVGSSETGKSLKLYLEIIKT